MAEFKQSVVLSIRDKLSPGIRRAEGTLKRFNRTARKSAESLKRFGKAMALRVTLPIGLLGGAFIKSASDMEESVNKIDVVFGKTGKSIIDFSETTLKRFGIAQGTTLEMAALFGDMSVGMGISQEKATELSKELIGLAGDVSSFKNISLSGVQTAFSGIFTGETEALKRLGVVMTETNLKEFLLEKGFKGKIKTLSQSQKVMLRSKFVIEALANSTGDFERTQAGAANQMRIFTETLKELAVLLGKELLPTFTFLLTGINKMLDGFRLLSPATIKTIVFVGGFLALVGPLALALGFLVTVLLAVGASLSGLAIAAGVTAALVALGAAAILIVENWDSAIKSLKFNLDTLAFGFDLLVEKARPFLEIITKIAKITKKFIPGSVLIGEGIRTGFSKVSEFRKKKLEESLSDSFGGAPLPTGRRRLSGRDLENALRRMASRDFEGAQRTDTNVSITLEQAQSGALSVKNVTRSNGEDRGKTTLKTGLMATAGAF